MSKRSKKCCTPDPIEQCSGRNLLIALIAFAVIYALMQQMNNIFANQNRLLLENTINNNNCLLNNTLDQNDYLLNNICTNNNNVAAVQNNGIKN